MKKSMVITIFLMLIATANAYECGSGILEMTSTIDKGHLGFGRYYYASRGSGLDGFDEYDKKLTSSYLNNMFEQTSYMFSCIPNYLLIDEVRANDESYDVFYIFLCFYGQPICGDATINASFIYQASGPFDNLNVYLSSAQLAYGRVICLDGYKTEDTMGIEFNVPLQKLDRLHYYLYEQYALVSLHIRPNKLDCIFDFNMDGIVDWLDFRVFADDWLKPKDCYFADTTGPNSIPDGFVNGYDLVDFAQDWLLCPVDFTNDGKVDLKDYAVLAANWQKDGLTDYISYDGFPDGKTNWFDLAALTKQYGQNKR